MFLAHAALAEGGLELPAALQRPLPATRVSTEGKKGATTFDRNVSAGFGPAPAALPPPGGAKLLPQQRLSIVAALISMSMMTKCFFWLFTSDGCWLSCFQAFGDADFEPGHFVLQRRSCRATSHTGGLLTGSAWPT